MHSSRCGKVLKFFWLSPNTFWCLVLLLVIKVASLSCTVNTFCSHLTSISYMFSVQWAGQNSKIASYSYLQTTCIKFLFITNVPAHIVTTFCCQFINNTNWYWLHQCCCNNTTNIKKKCIFLFTSQNLFLCSIISHLIYKVRHKSVNTPVRHMSVNTPSSHERHVVRTWLAVYSGWGKAVRNAWHGCHGRHLEGRQQAVRGIKWC